MNSLTTITERKAYKKAATVTGFALLLYYVMLNVFSFYALSVTGIAQIPAWLLQNGAYTPERLPYFFSSIFNDPVILNLTQLLSVLLAFVLVFPVLFRKEYKESLKGKFSMSKSSFLLVLGAVPVMLLLNFIGNLFFSGFQFTINQFGFDYDLSVLMDTDYHGFALGFYLLYACLAGPVVEELIYRGFLLNTFKKYGNLSCVLISAVMFALMHGFYAQIPMAFLIGLLFGYVALKTNSILPSILLHIINNSLATVMDYGTDYLFGSNPLLLGLFTLFYLLLLLLLSALSLGLGRKHLLLQQTFNFKDGKQIGWYFSTAVVVVLCSVYLLQGALFILPL